MIYVILKKKEKEGFYIKSLPITKDGMAGKGSEIGRNFDELKRIIDGIKYNKNNRSIK